MPTVTFMTGFNQNTKEHKVFIVNNQGKFGVNWMLAHTYLDFVKKDLPHFNTAKHKETGFHAKYFELWGMLVQGNALTSWSMIIGHCQAF